MLAERNEHSITGLCVSLAFARECAGRMFPDYLPTSMAGSDFFPLSAPPSTSILRPSEMIVCA